MSYNGWANWETWNTYTWLSTDEGTYDELRYRLRKTERPWDIGEIVREVVEEMVGLENLNGLALDFLTSALEKVDWAELAIAFIHEMNES